MSSTLLSLRMRLAANERTERVETGGEGERTFEINVVFVRDGQDVVALVGLDGLDEVSLRVFEVDLDSTNRMTRAGSNQKRNEEDKL